MKSKNILLVFVAIISLSLVYMLIRTNYGLLESDVEVLTHARVAEWNILVDSKSLGQTEVLRLTNCTFENDSHVSEGYIAPGSIGHCSFKINPNNSGTAVLYTIEYEDHNNEPNNILNVNGITIDDESVVRTGEYSYSGIITLDDIRNEKQIDVSIEVEWVNDEDNNDFDTQIGLGDTTHMFIDLNLNAIQYVGQELTPYIGANNE